MQSDLDRKTSTRERILHATLRMISNEGVQNVTTRKIAIAADVNVAAINYHFGSKDNAINEALKVLMHKLIRSYDFLDDTSLPPESRLRNFLMHFADAALEYSDVFRTFISQAMNNSTISFEYIEFMKKNGLEKLKAILREITHIQNEDVLLMKIFQMFSSLEFPVLLGNQMKDVAKFDYADKDSRYQYVDLLLKSLLS